MATTSQQEIKDYVEKHIDAFHTEKLEKLKKLQLAKILARKNPYLYKAKNLVTPRVLVKALLDAFLSSQEETTLGNFLEGLAVFICRSTYGAHGKSIAEGIDLEFERDAKRYIVTIKSGPNWGNSGQIREMRDKFKKAKIIYSQGASGTPIIAINGCCYGRQPIKSEDKGDYIKLCGQRFWTFISGDSELYTKIIEPLGSKAKERNEEFAAQYELVIDAFTELFRADFCDDKNMIDWTKLTQFNSGETQPVLKMLKKSGAVDATPELLDAEES